MHVNTVRMRLRRLHIKNFLSLKEASIELNKLNVFIGPNASGKSNVLKALRLVRNHIDKDIPVLEEGGLNVIPFGDLVYCFDRYRDIEIEMEIEHEEGQASYHLKLSAEGYNEIIMRGNEILYECDGRHAGFKYITKDGKMVEVGSGILPIVSIFFREPEGRTELKRQLFFTPFLRSPPADIDEALYKVSMFLRKIGAFRLDPASIRFRSKITEEPLIKYDGSNLARYLLYLYLERRGDFQRVEEVIKSLVPEVEEVVPHIEADDVEIWVRSRNLSMPLKPDYISDGTLRLLAMATILNAGFSLVAVEEPENHVHPSLLEAVVDLARRSPSQVMFTTHSPHLLDHLKPEEVFVVGMVGPETRVKRLTETEEFEVVRRYLEEGGTLGEAWYSRFFGEVE